MNELEHLLQALDERQISQQVTNRHDEARLRYPLSKNTVTDFAEFQQVLGTYYAYHFGSCVAPGAKLPDTEAQERAKELVVEEYRQTGGTLSSACADAVDGSNGGMRRLLDIIADGLKRESLRRYMESVFDRFVAPNSFEDKVEIIRQFLERFSIILGSGVNVTRPEQYASDYKQIIRAYIEGMRQNARVFRRV